MIMLLSRQPCFSRQNVCFYDKDGITILYTHIQYWFIAKLNKKGTFSQT